MTVRAWFVISALVLAALAAAFAFRVFAPIPAPEIVVRSAGVRLDGARTAYCWPQREGNLRCDRGGASSSEPEALPRSGRLRFTAAYPVQPKDGSIRIDRAATGDAVLRSGWKRSLAYELAPGAYRLTAEARYPERAFVRYVFLFSVTRMGS